jgi:hypothetical protein
MEFKNIEELNLYLDSKDELTHYEWVDLVEKNFELINDSKLEKIEKNYNTLKFKDFGFSYFEFFQEFNEDFY